jgi:hypothetical protein
MTKEIRIAKLEQARATNFSYFVIVSHSRFVVFREHQAIVAVAVAF